MRVATELSARRTFAVLFLLGCLAGLGQVPFSLPPVALFALGNAAWLLRRAPSGRRALWQGFAVGTGYFAVTLHWIVEPFLVDVARHGWMAPFALLFIATGFALFWALAFWVAHRLGRGGGLRFALAFALALGAVEMARSYVLTGFPWALLGYIFSESGAAQLAAWIGPFGLTLVVAFGAGLSALARLSLLRAGVAVLAWYLPVLLGQLIQPAPPAIHADAPVVRLIQPNAPQDEKWDPDRAHIFFQRQLGFTAEVSGVERPDLVIWPETAVPFLVAHDHTGVSRNRPCGGRCAGSLRGAAPEGVARLQFTFPHGRVRRAEPDL